MTTTVGARDAAWATAIHRPLTRRGHGPGLIILTEEGHGVPKDGMLDPPPAQKWAEEGFAIAAVTIGADAETVDLKQVLQNAADELDGLDVCDQKGRFGLISELR